MLDYYFISSCDGALHDTRADNWSANPIRPDYSRHFSSIDTVAQLKATLRAGPYAWPGGYPLYFITSDGAALSFDTVRAELHQVIYSIANQIDDGWRVVACDINHEDSDLYDAHTSEKIESAHSD
jgi:hypothetical protein